MSIENLAVAVLVAVVFAQWGVIVFLWKELKDLLMMVRAKSLNNYSMNKIAIDQRDPLTVPDDRPNFSSPLSNFQYPPAMTEDI